MSARRPVPGFPPRHHLASGVARPFVTAQEQSLSSPGNRRLLAFAVVALLGVGAIAHRIANPPVVSGQTQETPTTSRPVELKNPPRSFVPAALRHQLQSLQDRTPDANEGAIGGAIGYLDELAGPEGTAPDWTDLEVVEAIDHPEAFRGGLVRVRGNLMRIRTRSTSLPNVPSGLIYKGWMLIPRRTGSAAVAWETTTLPEGIERGDEIEVEGVFLQTVQYESEDLVVDAPFLVVNPVHKVATPASRGLDKPFFVMGFVFLVILILFFLMYMFGKSRRKGGPPARAGTMPPNAGRDQT